MFSLMLTLDKTDTERREGVQLVGHDYPHSDSAYNSLSVTILALLNTQMEMETLTPG